MKVMYSSKLILTNKKDYIHALDDWNNISTNETSYFLDHTNDIISIIETDCT